MGGLKVGCMQSAVTFRCDDGLLMPGLLTTPDGQLETPWPGLLLIYEAFGMNDEMGRVAAAWPVRGVGCVHP